MNSALSEIAYDFGLHRYLGIAQGEYVGQTSFYDDDLMDELWALTRISVRNWLKQP